jgi:hypothetical protein
MKNEEETRPGAGTRGKFALRRSTPRGGGRWQLTIMVGSRRTTFPHHDRSHHERANSKCRGLGNFPVRECGRRHRDPDHLWDSGSASSARGRRDASAWLDAVGSRSIPRGSASSSERGTIVTRPRRRSTSPVARTASTSVTSPSQTSRSPTRIQDSFTPPPCPDRRQPATVTWPSHGGARNRHRERLFRPPLGPRSHDRRLSRAARCPPCGHQRQAEGMATWSHIASRSPRALQGLAAKRDTP